MLEDPSFLHWYLYAFGRGGTIAYMTRFQPTVALSSTEAEFIAARDAGKMSLYIHSALWDLNIP
jgi:hypothetical protein